MGREFPPQAKHPQDVELLVEMLASVVEGRNALYVSSPLTTGSRAFDWHQKNGTRSAEMAKVVQGAAFQRQVTEPNQEQAARFARELRRSSDRVVIDPTAVAALPGWTQSDYRSLWARVIQRYVDAIVFRDGWQHSSGCAYEFLVAASSNVRPLHEDLTPLPLAEGRALLLDALEQNRVHGIGGDFLSAILGALETASK